MTAGPGWDIVQATRLHADGSHARQHVAVADEVAVSLRYHDIAHAVMMATPADLRDFAVGFSLAEGIARIPDDIRDVVQTATAPGEITLDIALSPDALRRFLAHRRLRNRVGHGGCGVCGVEDFAAALPLPDNSPSATPITAAAVLRAVEALHDSQVLAQRTHACHAAAWARTDGSIALIREDIGRHNALDKLVGALTLRTEPGFCVITSRCSVELVQKAAMAGMATLVALSHPTAMAIEWAERAGLTLIASARNGGCTVYTEPQTQEWRTRHDSNVRPSPSEGDALSS